MSDTEHSAVKLILRRLAGSEYGVFRAGTKQHIITDISVL